MLEVSLEEANLLLNALEIAPLPFVKVAPLVQRMREVFTKQLNIAKEIKSESEEAAKA